MIRPEKFTDPVKDPSSFGLIPNHGFDGSDPDPIRVNPRSKLYVASADGSRCAGWASYRESSSRGCPHSRSHGSLIRVHRLVLSHALHTGACPLHAPSSPLRKPLAARRTASLYASHGSHARRLTIARSSSPRDP